MRAPHRIGLLGDIHAEDQILALSLRVLIDEGAERLLAVGDIVDGPGNVDRCCDQLAHLDVKAVRGNHERWFLKNVMRDLPDATRYVGMETRRFLCALPLTLRFEVPGGEALLCHGLGDDDMASVDLDASERALGTNPPLAALAAEDRSLWVLNGHSHHRGVWSCRRLTVINAGTLYRDHDPCFALIDFDQGEVTYFLVQGGGRVTREIVPLPPPRGGRR